MKYADTRVTFAEVPDEITLCINISNCPCKCEGCHSSYLAEDIGKTLDDKSLKKLILRNKGITCISFMGGDSDPSHINKLARWLKTSDYKKLKVAWYSGRQKLSNTINIKYFDFIKLGPYKENLGGLDKKTTNQKFYKVFHFSNGTSDLLDITYKFQKI